MDQPTLLLLHGLGATRRVWDGVVERWDGDAVAVDLAGHGSAPPLTRYSFGALAAAVEVDTTRRYVAVGHSLGGVVALALASGWFGVDVEGVVGLGIKVAWSAEDLARAAATAAKPPRTFATRAEAAAWAGRLAGLPGGLDDPDAVVRDGGAWRASLDQRAFAVGAPDVAGLLRAARCPVVLATGERDPLCSGEQLAALVEDPVVLPGLGHDAHVADPAAVLGLVRRLGQAPGLS
ncbi:alpha/beta fold hydrolase [Actinokineospora bangkokensis]|uniref:Alpha/beta hydrolase n=1 Tax=Actinokineospora bangkokensis TaxID=1193682 RepID=A0A1Q9LRE1_9PSEU|nr:alpha/beta hydrolase [Actinokineospora bangkokensis]OLR94595.1 alpha/beta hydrolase [Actinokineospora bangkokensis]